MSSIKPVLFIIVSLLLFNNFQNDFVLFTPDPSISVIVNLISNTFDSTILPLLSKFVFVMTSFGPKVTVLGNVKAGGLVSILNIKFMVLEFPALSSTVKVAL